ncbi:ABC transporter ATP-binding protein [Amycolatopsis sp. GM8]|uniref:ABC transporter ATP-binding protein n=1 Tax=Amycolatopsis sp. GM8 TaxID=2896530 RepID=UPI001F29B855|nr:ABC transporter ATP-binding protein [Amycolatopsis sp. GM8]
MSKRFPGGTLALDDVTLRGEPGQIVVLVGPSGCGKTTLLRCLAGLDSVTAGEIHLQGRDAAGVQPHLRGVAMVFQNYALYPNKTVAQNIAFPLRMSRVPRRERDARAREMAEILKIGHLLDRRPRQLSGGQKQRVGIGRALVRRPAIVAMDEPLSNLDAQLRVEMRAEIRALQQRLGMTVVYVTHDQTEALSLADQIVVMNGGAIEQAGSAEEAFNTPATPFVAGFLGAMNLVSATGEAIPLPRWLSADDRDVVATIGVRPEHLIAGRPPEGRWSVSGRVISSELLGTERLVAIRVGHNGEQSLRIRVPAELPLSSELYVWAQDEHLHAFDGDGKRLNGEGVR